MSWTIETLPVSTEGRTFAKAGQDSRTPRRYRDLHAPSDVRQVLEQCAAPAALFFGQALVASRPATIWLLELVSLSFEL